MPYPIFAILTALSNDKMINIPGNFLCPQSDVMIGWMRAKLSYFLLESPPLFLAQKCAFCYLNKQGKNNKKGVRFNSNTLIFN